MKTVLTLLLALLHILNTLAFNLATDYYLVYTNPKDNNTLFGLSVILHGEKNENESWVQIGAPARITSKYEHSLVYRCNIGEKCRTLNFGKSVFEGDGWMGSVMDINEANNLTVVCEPLAKRKYKDKGLRGDLFAIGACYIVDFSGNVTDVLKPLNRPDNMYYTAKKLPYFYGLGEFGFSARFADNYKNTDIIFGAPGILNWIGYPLKYEKHETIIGDINDFIHSKHNVLRSHSYIGYSTTAGRFNRDCNTCFAYGAPKSAEAKGTVLILSHDFQLKQLLFGNQIGEYFGGALAAGDINADGYDDLIVGSPSYSISSYSEGCIHLFLGTVQKLSGDQYICGSKPGAHFGTSISYLFDLDGDGYGDVAVGAPYEDGGRGVVYIYNGSPTGLIPKPSQKILGRSIYDNLRGFGYSISNPADIDANYYNDIAVGAYKSGHVVIIQSKPIVTIYQSLKQTTTLSSASQLVEVLACFKYEAKNYNKSIKINTSLYVEPMHISLEKELPKDLVIQNHQQRCENITLKINTNKHTNIRLRLNSTLIDMTPSTPTVILANNESNYRSSFCTDCVLSNRTHSTVLDLYIPFSLRCKNTTICFANYYTKSTFLNIRKNTIIVGTRKSVSLKIDAINDGENAYLATIDIELPPYVQFGMIPTICKLYDNKLSCNIDDPLSNTTKTALSSLDLDLEGISKGIFDDNFEVKITTHTESRNLANNLEILPVKLMYCGAITLTKQVFNNLEIMYKENTSFVIFNDMYKVENLGPSPAAVLTIKFLIPTALNNEENVFLNSTILADFTDNSNFRCTIDSSYKKITKQDAVYVEVNRPYELNLANLTVVLDCLQENVLCQEIICTTGFLLEHDFLKIPLQMNFSSNAVVDIVGDKNVIVIAVDASVSVNEPKLYASLGSRSAIRTYSVIMRETQKHSIETWIIISSMTVGFLSLMVLTVALWKAGFFERTKKKALEHEKKVLTTGEFYNYSETLPSVERNFINPNVLLRGEDDH